MDNKFPMNVFHVISFAIYNLAYLTSYMYNSLSPYADQIGRIGYTMVESSFILNLWSKTSALPMKVQDPVCICYSST